VVIEVNKKAADYFKRRKIFPTQEILEEKTDGSLLVKLKVGKYEEVRDLLKSWLPNVRILRPEVLKKDVVAEMNKWITWQISSNVNMQV
jgi:predicted DNA-binding transcriptional regulator YafY